MMAKLDSEQCHHQKRKIILCKHDSRAFLFAFIFIHTQLLGGGTAAYFLLRMPAIKYLLGEKCKLFER